jgi:hypothetical protein
MPVVFIGRITSFEAEHIGPPNISTQQMNQQQALTDVVLVNSHEVVPLHDLGPLRSIAASESLRVHQTTQWISSSISTVRVHFTAIIASLDIDLSLVDESNYLNVRWSSGELDTLECSCWNETCTLARRTQMLSKTASRSMPEEGDHSLCLDEYTKLPFHPRYHRRPNQAQAVPKATMRTKVQSYKICAEGVVYSRLTQKSSMLFTKPVWHNDSGPSVVELHSC